MKYQLDIETADGICRDVLCETIKLMKKSIKDNKQQIKLKGSKTPTALMEDLRCDEEYLEAIKKTYQYFGGKI